MPAQQVSAETLGSAGPKKTTHEHSAKAKMGVAPPTGKGRSGAEDQLRDECVKSNQFHRNNSPRTTTAKMGFFSTLCKELDSKLARVPGDARSVWASNQLLQLEYPVLRTAEPVRETAATRRMMTATNIKPEVWQPATMGEQYQGPEVPWRSPPYAHSQPGQTQPQKRKKKASGAKKKRVSVVDPAAETGGTPEVAAMVPPSQKRKIDDVVDEASETATNKRVRPDEPDAEQNGEDPKAAAAGPHCETSTGLGVDIPESTTSMPSGHQSPSDEADTSAKTNKRKRDTDEDDAAHEGAVKVVKQNPTSKRKRDVDNDEQHDNANKAVKQTHDDAPSTGQSEKDDLPDDLTRSHSSPAHGICTPKNYADGPRDGRPNGPIIPYHTHASMLDGRLKATLVDKQELEQAFMAAASMYTDADRRLKLHVRDQSGYLNRRGGSENQWRKVREEINHTIQGAEAHMKKAREEASRKKIRLLNDDGEDEQ
ncbi:hypothetical protein LTR37_008070 [Vermiconidia calcicola]|uniref:Uncharacterized protein n=1 Tax=Vermiconidia calcicola TaxID=1690605 RepID=A0ACC3NEH5_9PEZI|nr:hypothetical protein LTR37_008070 [Vermiconidia calcicola]